MNETAAYYGSIPSNKELYIDMDGIMFSIFLGVKEGIGKRLGCGGAKCAYNLGDLVIMLPNRISQAANYWPQVVDGEVGMSNVLTNAGLLNPKNKLARLCKTTDPNDIGIPCYVSKSFKSFAEEGIYVIEPKSQDRYIKNDGIFLDHNKSVGGSPTDLSQLCSIFDRT